MKKIIGGIILAGALALGAASPAQAAISIPTKSGRAVFTAATTAKLKSAAEQKTIKARSAKFKSPVAFESDIRGCEIQYKVRTVQQSDCINISIRFHKQYI